jgi:hypothetical protein
MVQFERKGRTIMETKINVVRYLDASNNLQTRMISDKSLLRWIKNWKWEYNGDRTGLEVKVFTFYSIFEVK